MKILLTGGTGLLGKHLAKELAEQGHYIISSTRDNFDLSLGAVEDAHWLLSNQSPDLIIHAGAMTDNRVVESKPAEAIMTNIAGTTVLAAACIRKSIRLVYISTDYVYQGDRGNYKESDPVLPFNLYAWTKLGGECAVRAVVNHLIIRTSFGAEFKYKQAFTDKYTSKDYVESIAPMIADAALSPLTGVINIGTERKSLYQHAVTTNPDVDAVRLDETVFKTPADTSMNLQRWEDYRNFDSMARPHNKCRACGSDRLEKYLDLGLMPLANNFAYTARDARNQQRFPLQVMVCKDCGLSQLSVVINPDKMFKYYTYRSSVNAGYVKHCREMAMDFRMRIGLDSDSFMVDIAGNDGTLLSEFKGAIGLKVLNVDPASNLTAIAEAKGIPSLAKFFSISVVADILANYGSAELITATNVFAHVDEIKFFLADAKRLLKDEGTIVLEFPYLLDFIADNEYDTVYFEHLSYLSIKPIDALCKSIGLSLNHIEHYTIHGGTVRVFINNESSTTWKRGDEVEAYIDRELVFRLEEVSNYKKWALSIYNSIQMFQEQILELKLQGASIAAFAASAKGNTLLNSAKMSTDIIDYIADETPEKIGKFSSGNGIPIVNKQMIVDKPVDYLIILSWNFADEIMAKVRALGFKGKFVLPIPSFKIVAA